ncbi:DUF2778 domain-containing protein [Methylobacterium sp. Leaf118]|uniref:DUF2778 domain-containing protein n=1 Tax=Methylobacterium sp. Leaf118 TaxID=2876562 RepID=UPI001E3F2E81|nr:DUF2778 domain-containing protein [Methylobacterium sp. Leaf118]
MDIAALVQGQTARPPRRHRRRPPLAALALTALGGVALAGLLQPDETAFRGEPERVEALAEAPPPPVASDALAWMLDPEPALAEPAPGFVSALPLARTLRIPAPAPASVAGLEAPKPAPAAPMTVAAASPPSPLSPAALSPAALAPSASSPAATPFPAAAPARVALTVPLPVRRPAALGDEARAAVARVALPMTPPMTPRLAARQPRESTRQVFSAAVSDDRSFFEKLFGGGSESPAPSGQALAYAGLENGAAESAARRRLLPGPVAEPGVAVYDISAATVTLPNGEVLEAHSGLGVAQDNPAYVHLRMRGATPPGVYDLREREAAFHGVRAIRLNPVGGAAAIHGRDGILAHTYMLGPSGASNGCVVFKNYHRFLQAYLRGEVRRIVVVPGSGPSLIAGRRGTRRSASAADGN